MSNDTKYADRLLAIIENLTATNNHLIQQMADMYTRVSDHTIEIELRKENSELVGEVKRLEQELATSEFFTANGIGQESASHDLMLDSKRKDEVPVKSTLNGNTPKSMCVALLESDSLTELHVDKLNLMEILSNMTNIESTDATVEFGRAVSGTIQPLRSNKYSLNSSEKFIRSAFRYMNVNNKGKFGDGSDCTIAKQIMILTPDGKAKLLQLNGSIIK